MSLSSPSDCDTKGKLSKLPAIRRLKKSSFLGKSFQEIHFVPLNKTLQPFLATVLPNFIMSCQISPIRPCANAHIQYLFIEEKRAQIRCYTSSAQNPPMASHLIENKVQTLCDGPCDLVPSELILYHSPSLTVFQPHWPFCFSNRPREFFPASELLQCCSFCLEDFSISVWVSFFSLFRSLFKHHPFREAFPTNLYEVAPTQTPLLSITLLCYFCNIACHNIFSCLFLYFSICFHTPYPPDPARSLRLSCYLYYLFIIILRI